MEFSNVGDQPESPEEERRRLEKRARREKKALQRRQEEMAGAAPSVNTAGQASLMKLPSDDPPRKPQPAHPEGNPLVIQTHEEETVDPDHISSHHTMSSVAEDAAELRKALTTPTVLSVPVPAMQVESSGSSPRGFKTVGFDPAIAADSRRSDIEKCFLRFVSDDGTRRVSVSLSPDGSMVDFVPTTSDLKRHLLQVSLLKRVMHSAKLSHEHRLIVLPERLRNKQHIHLIFCVKQLTRHAERNATEVDEILEALNKVDDSIVKGKNVMGMLNDRLSNLVQDTRAIFADNSFRRVWDMIHVCTILIFYTMTLVTNVLHWESDFDTPGQWQFIVFLIFHFFWLADFVLTTQVFTVDKDGRLVKDTMGIVMERKWVLIIDGIGFFPLDFILEKVSFEAFLFFRLLKLVKLFRVRFMFEIVNRDIITPSIVTFFFQYKPVIIGLYWLLVFIHLCAVVHNLIDQYEISPRQFTTYGDSLVAVCIMLSGANAQVEVYATGDKLLCIPLAVLSLFGQGVLVGKLTALVFRNSVSAENYQLMRDTLNIVRHYKVPKSIQREVLSYQMHALNDDVARHMRNLETLPQQMQNEIVLYIKLDAVGKVKMFTSASRDCRMKLAGSLERVIVEPEVEVVKFGEVGNDMFMVAHGYADVILGNGKIVTTFTRGDCFGEMALVQKDSKRNATVRALTYCDMWTLQKDSFLEALALFPDFQHGIELEVEKRNGNVSDLRDAVAIIHAELHKSKDGEGQTDSDSSEVGSPTAAELDVNMDHGLKRMASTTRLQSLPTSTLKHTKSNLFGERRPSHRPSISHGLQPGSASQTQLPSAGLPPTAGSAAYPPTASAATSKLTTMAKKSGDQMDVLEKEMRSVRKMLEEVRTKASRQAKGAATGPRRR